VLFAFWITLFFAMVTPLMRNWQAQNVWFHTTASSLEKHDGEFTDAYGKAVVSGDPIVDRKTGQPMDPAQIKKERRKVCNSERSGLRNTSSWPICVPAVNG
jgi:hypothetical protein